MHNQIRGDNLRGDDLKPPRLVTQTAMIQLVLPVSHQAALFRDFTGRLGTNQRLIQLIVAANEENLTQLRWRGATDGS